MTRPKSPTPLRHFSLSLPTPLYRKLIERQAYLAEKGRNVSVSGIIVAVLNREFLEEVGGWTY